MKQLNQWKWEMEQKSRLYDEKIEREIRALKGYWDDLEKVEDYQQIQDEWDSIEPNRKLDQQLEQQALIIQQLKYNIDRKQQFIDSIDNIQYADIDSDYNFYESNNKKETWTDDNYEHKLDEINQLIQQCQVQIESKEKQWIEVKQVGELFKSVLGVEVSIDQENKILMVLEGVQIELDQKMNLVRMEPYLDIQEELCQLKGNNHFGIFIIRLQNKIAYLKKK